MESNNKVKCISVRLLSLESISDKAYKATDFNGNSDVLPKSQVFGQDFEVQNSDAYWVAEWILQTKKLTYGSKFSYFDKFQADGYSGGQIEAKVHVPESKEPVTAEIPSELKNENPNEWVQGWVTTEVWEEVKTKWGKQKQKVTKIVPFAGFRKDMPKHISFEGSVVGEEPDFEKETNYLVFIKYGKDMMRYEMVSKYKEGIAFIISKEQIDTIISREGKFMVTRDFVYGKLKDDLKGIY